MNSKDDERLNVIDAIVIVLMFLFVGMPGMIILGALSVRWTIFLLDQVTK